MVAVALVALGPSPAHAEEGELAWSVGGGLHSTVTLSGGGSTGRFYPLATGGVRYSLSDFWELGGFLSGGVGLGGGVRAEGMAHLAAEVRYVIDALQWVPYLCAGAGVLLRTDGPDVLTGVGSGPAVDATVHVGVGVEYRPSRDWSVGGVVRYHVALSDLSRTVGPIDVAITVSFYSD